MQYADFALWQRDLLGDPADAGSLYARQSEHWRVALAGLPDEIPLPADRPRPEQPSARGATLRRRLPAATALGLAAVQGASTFMVAQAAVAALLQRLGAGDDIPLGAPIAGRTDAALDDVVGFFVNTVVVRHDLDGAVTFADVLARSRDASLAAFEHQELPFEAIVDAVGPPRVPGRNPLFQTMVAHETGAVDAEGFLGLQAESADFENGVAKFDLNLIFAERGRELDVVVEYSTDRFDADTVERLLDDLVALLGQVVADRLIALDAIALPHGARAAATPTAPAEPRFGARRASGARFRPRRPASARARRAGGVRVRDLPRRRTCARACRPAGGRRRG